jgi:decaprenylphospho-beta-D-erythro-pentofuranosid-2-ulose 2-reductase
VKILLLGGTSEIGLAILSALELGADNEVILAGRDVARLEVAGKVLPCEVSTVEYDALDVSGHQAFADSVCASGAPDLVIAAAGVLLAQSAVESDVSLAAAMIDTNFTGHVTTLLAFGAKMKARGSGTIVVLSSVAAVRPRKFNSVYGAAKAGLDAFARGYADSLHGSGVSVLLVRPGFVTGRMTAGMTPAPLSTTPEAVGVAVASALRRSLPSSQSLPSSRSFPTVWVPASLSALATAMRLVPRPIWRKLDR